MGREDSRWTRAEREARPPEQDQSDARRGCGSILLFGEVLTAWWGFPSPLLALVIWLAGETIPYLMPAAAALLVGSAMLGFLCIELQ